MLRTAERVGLLLVHQCGQHLKLLGGDAVGKKGHNALRSDAVFNGQQYLQRIAAEEQVAAFSQSVGVEDVEFGSKLWNSSRGEIRPPNAIRAGRGADGGPHLVSVLRAARKCANIRSNSAVIWGIPTNLFCRIRGNINGYAPTGFGSWIRP